VSGGMEQKHLLDAHVQARKMYQLLGEVHDLSKQMAEALDRNDEVTVQMLISMRHEPIGELARIREVLREQAESAAQTGDGRLRELLGGAEARAPEENGLAAQVAMNGRLLKQVQALEENLNRKIGRENSIFG